MRTQKPVEVDLIEFILWLTPCGQVTPAPKHELIGKKARNLLKRIIAQKILAGR
jgi:hypothetical protein